MSDEWATVPTRAERQAAAEAEHLAKRAELGTKIAAAVEVKDGAALVAPVLEHWEAGNAARDHAKVERPRARQLGTHAEAREDRPPPDSALAQHAKPPPHLTRSDAGEAAAAKAAHLSAGRAGVREPVYFPEWVRKGCLRICESKGRALSELTALPRWAADSVLKEAAPYGGADTVPGRNVIALSWAIWWLGKRLAGRISGMPRAAWTSLTLGSFGKHYSHSRVWHPVHKSDGELEPDARGPAGGRIGMGCNRGFMVSIMRAGWMRTIVPSAFGLPAWMCAASGWPFVQVLVSCTEPSDDPDTS